MYRRNRDEKDCKSFDGFSFGGCNRGGGALIGCKAPTDDNVDITEISMWAGGQWQGTDYANMKKFVNEYNKIKPDGFIVNLQPKSDLEISFATTIRSGKQPDLMVWDRFNTPTYAKDDKLMPIDDLIERDKVDLSAYNAESMKELTYDKKVYGLPLDLDTWGVYVNLDLVAHYNTTAADADKIVLTDGKLATDWSWDDMLAMAKKLHGCKSGVSGYSSGDQQEHLYKYAVSAGVDIIKDGKAHYDTQQTKDILEFFKEVKDANVGGNQEKDQFTAQKLAMVNNPTYYSSYIKEKNPNMKYQFLPQPKYSVDGVVQEGAVNGGMIGGYGIAVPKPLEKYNTVGWKARHEAAWKFTKWWLTSEENMLAWAKTTNTLPALTAVYDDEFIKSNATLASASAYVVNYKIRPQVPGFLKVQTEAINTTVQLYLNGSKNLADTISNLTTKTNVELS